MPDENVIHWRQLLHELGFGHPEAAARATAVLVDAKLVNANRELISAAKRDRCAALLAERLARLCDGCAAAADASRERVPLIDRVACEGCSGSANRAAIERAAEAFRRSGLRRLVVVGGSPGVHAELRRLWPLELRIVDGTERHTRDVARSNLAWADRVAVLGSSELNHKVSEHYSRSSPPYRRKVIVVPKRGVAALADTLASRAQR